MSSIVVAGDTSGTIIIAAPAVAGSGTLTLPVATDTLVGKATTDTLTNKSIAATQLTGTLAVLQGGTGVTTSTGTGANVLGTSPTLTTPTFDSASLPTISGTAPLYMCRAWVNFNGTSAGTFDGGASTVSRVATTTLCTVTTTTAHNLITGNAVYAATGVVAGSYTVTYVSATQFTFTTAATTVLSAVAITFNTRTIRAGGNVGSIAYNGVGDYTVNFTTAMVDANYGFFGTAGGANTGSGTKFWVNQSNNADSTPPTTGGSRFIVGYSDNINADCSRINIAIVR